jgi:hypothetical protein
MPLLFVIAFAPTNVLGAEPTKALGHPRLYFDNASLAELRGLRDRGVHARIYDNLIDSADWCLTRTPRETWIAPVTPDPIYENLYDRFYGMMHDTAVTEHLAFAYAYSGEAKYLDGARRWTLACCRVWRAEADGEPDASKAYAVTRIIKGLAVAYDLIYDGLADDERDEIRDTLVTIGRKYYPYFQDPAISGPGHDKHHGSLEAAAFGVVALALLGEVPEARAWLDLMIDKHTGYLMENALTPTGTQEQSSNYWASTMQYRLFFIDALRRVTGRDLFAEYREHMPGRIALAAVAGPNPRGPNENDASVLFGPSYGQLDYWSPVLLYLARETRRPVFQRLALWDEALGSIQKTRYVTSNGEQLLFELGGYAYAWYDPSVPDRHDPNVPYVFAFPDVNETYMRTSYEPGGIVVAMRRGRLVVHAGGRPVLSDQFDVHHQPMPVEELSLTDDGTTAVMRFKGTPESVYSEQRIEMIRPDRLVIHRQTKHAVRWSCHGKPVRDGNVLTWPNGTRLEVIIGRIDAVDPQGQRDEKVVGLGKLKLVDPLPKIYPVVTAIPDDGMLTVLMKN